MNTLLHSNKIDGDENIPRFQFHLFTNIYAVGNQIRRTKKRLTINGYKRKSFAKFEKLLLFKNKSGRFSYVKLEKESMMLITNVKMMLFTNV